MARTQAKKVLTGNKSRTGMRSQAGKKETAIRSNKATGQSSKKNSLRSNSQRSYSNR